MKKKNTELTEAKAKVNVEAEVSQRCEGYRRHGGIMTLGPVTWEQCENKADVILRIKQDGEKAKDMPACMQCWKEAQDPRWNIKILSAKPIATSG